MSFARSGRIGRDRTKSRHLIDPAALVEPVGLLEADELEDGELLDDVGDGTRWHQPRGGA